MRDYVEDAYISRAADYIAYRLGKSRLEDESISLLQRCDASKFASGDVLDLGCGFGMHTTVLRYRRYIGADISLPLLRHHFLGGARRSMLVQVDLEHASPPAVRFDAVVSVLAINYIERPKRLLRRVARAGTRFALVIPNQAFDMRFGLIERGVAHIRLAEREFCYYSHNVTDIVDALGPREIRVVGMSPVTTNDEPYIALAGRW